MYIYLNFLTVYNFIAQHDLFLINSAQRCSFFFLISLPTENVAAVLIVWSLMELLNLLRLLNSELHIYEITTCLTNAFKSTKFLWSSYKVLSVTWDAMSPALTK